MHPTCCCCCCCSLVKVTFGFPAPLAGGGAFCSQPADHRVFRQQVAGVTTLLFVPAPGRCTGYIAHTYYTKVQHSTPMIMATIYLGQITIKIFLRSSLPADVRGCVQEDLHSTGRYRSNSRANMCYYTAVCRSGRLDGSHTET